MPGKMLIIRINREMTAQKIASSICIFDFFMLCMMNAKRAKAARIRMIRRVSDTVNS